MLRVPEFTFADLATDSQIKRPILMGIKAIFWSLALLTLVALAMQLGVWHKTFNITGPFAAETDPPRRSLKLMVPDDGVAWWRQSLIGDTNEIPLESRLELQINGHSMGPPHTQHEAIHNGETKGFSHWHDRVIFALPPGTENAASTTATLRYSIKPRLRVTAALLALTVLLCGLLYGPPLSAFRPYLLSQDSVTRRAELLLKVIYLAAPPLLKTAYLALLALYCIGLIGAALFAACSICAFIEGWALPTTAIIRWWPFAEWAARNEPYLPYLLLTLAGLGALTTWLSGPSPTGYKSLERDELRLRKLLGWTGLPIAACAYAFCLSAMWSGLVRPGDLDGVSIGGLIPFTDAHGYLATSYDQARDGIWNSWTMRRPLAAALRSVLLFFGQYSIPQMLLLQACLLGAAAWAASYAVMAWRGVWAAIGFFGLTYIYTRIFAPTSLTEPLGLFWALLSVPFFIDAFRSGSVKSAQVGFAMTALALMIRMGNMFAIPALLIWLVWQFGKGIAAKARIGLVSIGILLAVAGLNSLLQKTYGDGYGSTGSNFSYTLCGLTLGTTWDGCPKQLEAEGGAALPEDILIAKMYGMAWQNFKARPGVFFHRLKEAAIAFYTQFPETMMKGYGLQLNEPSWFSRSALSLISLVGIALVAVRRSTWRERTFWVLLWASLTVSAGFVYFDDGPRVLAASLPLIALFLATGLANPHLQETVGKAPDHRLPLYGSIGLLLTATLFACVPWISHRVSSGYVAAIPKRLEGQIFVLGGKRMSGFLVVANGEPLRSDVPTIHLSDFEGMIAQSLVENYYQGLLHPVAPPLPFGFVFAPRLEAGILSDHQYIVPAKVMETPGVAAWRFKFEPWQHKPGLAGDYWVHVVEAVPWSP
jgi:hypothetical protein